MSSDLETAENDLRWLAQILTSSKSPFWTKEWGRTSEFSSFANRVLLVVKNAAHSVGSSDVLSAIIIEISHHPDHADDFGVQGHEKIIIGERVLERLNRAITA